MMPGAHHEEVVQIFEIMMIVREKGPILADRCTGSSSPAMPTSEGRRTSWPACRKRRVSRAEALSSSK
jgi:hypothetical protein